LKKKFMCMCVYDNPGFWWGSNTLQRIEYLPLWKDRGTSPSCLSYPYRMDISTFLSQSQHVLRNLNCIITVLINHNLYPDLL
jgi:hypothetical protein